MSSPNGPLAEDRPHVQKRTTQLAFTLIEIMIAIVIFATVMIAIYSSWSAILRGSKAGLEAAAEAQRMRVALRSIEESLASIQMFSANAPYYSFFADTSGDYAALSFVSRLSSSFPGGGLYGGLTVRRVTFMVTNSPPQLMIMQSPILEAPETTKPYEIVLVPNIKRFALDFWDSIKGEWISEWPLTNQFPKLIRVTVAFGDARNKNSEHVETATRVVALNAIPVPGNFQAPTIGGNRNIGGGTTN
ncbi:MAG: prepilin-type N-terminal cleavage/methylation domain-containing protein, partial [Verrucomicrobiota bacterium]